MELIIDDRERAVTPFISSYCEKNHIEYKIRRLEIGDYAICYKSYILIIIERKTWEDLSSSMRDGRKSNVNKLIDLREKTGCQIAYLIEGSLCPDDNLIISGIPSKYLQSHLDHLAFRDGIHMLYSIDQDNSANRLVNLLKNYLTIKPSIINKIDELTNDDNLENLDNLDSKEIIGASPNKEKLTERQISQINISELLLQCLPSIGSVLSNILSENNITILSLYNQINTIDEIARLKYPTGGTIGLKKAECIFNSKKILISDSIVNKKIQVKILSNIPLISKQTAEKILSITTIKDILEENINEDSLSMINKTEKTKLGKKAASNIIKYLVK